MFSRGIAAIVSAFTVLATPAFATDLLLACVGHGSRTTVSNSFGTVTTPRGNTYAGQGTQYRRETLAEQVLIEISGESGRIFFPSSLLPPIRGRSDAGWRPIDRLEITESAIEGRFRINGLNRPSVEIDRMTGTIEIDGLGSTGFSGVCEALEPDQRRF